VSHRPDIDFGGVTGTITGGAVALGDRVRVQPSGVETAIAHIVKKVIAGLRELNLIAR